MSETTKGFFLGVVVFCKVRRSMLGANQVFGSLGVCVSFSECEIWANEDDHGF